MKISLNWLRELADLPTNISAEDIGEKITLHTAELEEVVSVSENFSGIFAGKLIDRKPHPESDKLTIGQFDCGKQGKKQIIFGQVHELEIGKIYPVALDGATLGNGQRIQNGEIRGQKSEGMVCDNSEMGMKNGSILTFSENDLGKSLLDICAEFGDALFDIDNKSLTHRPDLMGHIGFAREYGAIFRTEKKIPEIFGVSEKIPGNSDLKVDITSPHCRRFMGVSVSNVSVQPSEIKDMIRLENLGTRAISNIVDITNLVMLEWGQPMHAFDADKISGKIIVRQAKNGEKLVALDENEYELTTDDIVIADEEKILSIAGIMGGLDSSVTEKTTNIVFESANFDPTVIRKTSARLGLRSESSMRFEKSLDPENAKNGLFAALTKLIEAQPKATISSGIADEYPQKPTEKTVSLSFDRVRKVSGIDLSDDDIIDYLTRLEFEILEKNPEKILVQIPSFRATKDVAIAEDLIEEIVRLHGFFTIEEQLPTLPIHPPKQNLLRLHEWNIRDFLSARAYTETYHSSFVSPDDTEWMEESDHIAMLNATNAETKFLRKTLASNMVRHLENELRKHKSLSIFEIGKIHTPPTNESLVLGLLKAEIGKNGEGLFYELKKDLIDLFGELNLTDIQTAPRKDTHAIEHPYRSADILFSGKIIGRIFELHPSKNTTKNSAVVYAEIDIETVSDSATMAKRSHKALSEFPVSTRDLSIVLPEKILIGDIESTLKEKAQNLKEIALFDEYRDAEKLGKDLKNLAFHLSFQSDTHTLTHEEVDEEFSIITEALKSHHQAQLRVDFDEQK